MARNTGCKYCRPCIQSSVGVAGLLLDAIFARLVYLAVRSLLTPCALIAFGRSGPTCEGTTWMPGEKPQSFDIGKAYRYTWKEFPGKIFSGCPDDAWLGCNGGHDAAHKLNLTEAKVTTLLAPGPTTPSMLPCLCCPRGSSTPPAHVLATPPSPNTRAYTWTRVHTLRSPSVMPTPVAKAITKARAAPCALSGRRIGKPPQ